MKNWIVLSMAVLCLFSFAEPVEAGERRKKKSEKIEKKDSIRPKKSKYEKLFSHPSHEVAKGEFLTIHKVKNKIYFEMPLNLFGRDMLIASTVKESSDPDLGIIGFKKRDPEHLKFILKDSLIMSVVPSKIENDDDISDLIKLSYREPYKKKYKIETYSPDSSAVVFDVTGLITPGAYPLQSSIGNYYIIGSDQSELNQIGAIRSYKDNASIELDLTYDCKILLFMSTIPYGRVSVKVSRSILLLPEETMMPRISDGRVGIFQTFKRKFSVKNDDVDESLAYANRWNLEPADMEAWKRGELVEPKKPIVYYVDTLFPEFWKAPVREGVLRWNQAFEKIGFKNAIQVRDFPKNDPEFDPGNLKYSCIRYVLTGTQNAMGPSWVDPRSGEIINASVIIYANLTKLINNWRFIQTAQVDPRVRTKKMPDDVMYESIVYAVAHEVGHTLGLMHNMAASHAYPVDSLRSAKFTQKYGTTPSIMDYARHNYVAQPGDKGLKLDPPALGVYDEFAIKWLYSPVPGAKTPEEVRAVTEKWLDEKAGDPMYRYGVQQFDFRYDPSALEEDLGDDPIKAGNYGIANLKYVMKHMNEWITDDPDGDYRFTLYNQLFMQYFRYLNNVLYNVGGIYCTQVKDGTKGKRFVPVDRKVQKESLAWVIKQLQNSEWLDDKSLRDLFPLFPSASSKLLDYVTTNLMKSYARVAISSDIAQAPYRMSDFYNDLYSLVFAKTIKGGALTKGERDLQRAVLAATAKSADKGMLKLFGLQGGESVEFSPLSPSLYEMIAYGLDKTGLLSKLQDKLQREEDIYGVGVRYCPEEVEDVNAVYPGYNFMRAINIKAIDESEGCVALFNQKVKSLVKARMNTANNVDKAHYMGLVNKIEKWSK